MSVDDRFLETVTNLVSLYARSALATRKAALRAVAKKIETPRSKRRSRQY
jgi:ribosomal protein L18E